MNGTGQAVLVAGAEGYLGQKAVAFFAGRGARVVASCRTPADRERVSSWAKSELGGAAYVHSVACDLSDFAAVRAMADSVEEAVGPIDALVNTAGGFRWASVPTMSAADTEFLISANFRSALALTQTFVPKMQARDKGRIVLVSAKGTLGQGEAGLGIYTATKAAVNALVLGTAAELRKTNVKINAVLPTIIDTPANRKDMPQANFGDWVAPEALLGVVAMLFSDAGSVFQGALVPVAGRS